MADLEQGHSGDATATALLRQQLESVQREVEGVRAGKQALEQQMQAQLALVAARKDAEIAGLRARLDAAATTRCVCRQVDGDLVVGNDE